MRVASTAVGLVFVLLFVAYDFQRRHDQSPVGQPVMVCPAPGPDARDSCPGALVHVVLLLPLFVRVSHVTPYTAPAPADVSSGCLPAAPAPFVPRAQAALLTLSAA